MSGPLAGIRILEIGHMLAGPYCGQLLADLGADIVKIEPADGDIARRVSPRVIGPHNEYFASLNRNKRSVVIDLASVEGQRALHDLAVGARGLITNLRPSAIHKLGLTYDALKQVNPALVCVALTGYGLNGSYAARPAYDYVIQAMTGVMEMTGEPNAPPTKTGYSAVDNSAGIMAAFGLVAQLLGRVHGLIQRTAFQQDAELISAQARSRVAFAHHATNSGGDFPQEFITNRMSQCVIDRLEAVEIEVEDCKVARSSFGLGQALLETLFEAEAVEKASQCVLQSHDLDLLFCAAARRDVFMR